MISLCKDRGTANCLQHTVTIPVRTDVWAGVRRVEGRVLWLVPRGCEARGRSPSISESGRLCDPLHVWWGQSQERLCLSKLLLQVLPKPKYRQWVLGGKVRSWFILHRCTDAHTFLPSKFSEKSVYITLTVIQPEEGKRIPTLSTVRAQTRSYVCIHACESVCP